ncbi:MAG TPA: AarF/ABC1/UbiB kinase family protein [Pyrinomonadaceae bacterium]|jgi:predicted unusual protein kinase regulating ubiquinone biosynthesis (AarF/ABC1/UbiB family)|nr:AarF/ABC1/UbiB kinase family protein [Pyrinomonadaceae bacterium]
MAATEPKKITENLPQGVSGGHASNGRGEDVRSDARARTSLALVKTAEGEGTGERNVRSRALPPSQRGDAATSSARNEVAGESPVEFEARGLRGWLRTLEIVRVLGTMSLYLFLNDYDVRAKFNRRASDRLREEARARGRVALFQEWSRDVDRRALDKLIRLVRLFVFRGSEGSGVKEAQLEKQSVWLREHLVKLGPTFIKIGQSLGTRADLLPLAYVKELSILQDQVPPFPTAEAFEIIERELGCSAAEAYAEIDTEPIAAASLGQVYRARLHTGQEVAVKVQRPALRETLGFDIAVLGRITRFISRFPSLTENADWEGMLREFRETINEEIDYEHEGRNAERFRANFRDWRAVHVPRIYWSHTTRRVLTMEFIRGTKVTDIEALRARRISPVKVNRLLVRAYLKQLLEDSFFHADPHPGNLLVMDTGHIAFFDFGMTGRITPRLQAQMIDAFFHVVGRDVHGLAQDLIDLNFLKPGVNPDEVRPVVEALFRQYLNLKLGDVNFKELTYDLAEVMYDYPFRLPSNFTYIIRALMTLEGIGLVTDPGFSFFDTAKPFAKEFMLRREGKHFRKLILNKITGRDTGDGHIEWGKVWKLAKLAAKTYFDK